MSVAIGPEVSSAWLVWWLALCAATAMNVAAWAASARALRIRGAGLPEDVRATRRRLLWLSALYVVGCGFRSFLPMVDVPRICLHDTWLSRIMVGRTVATVAELAFAAQWALLLREAGSAAGGGLARSLSKAVVPLIAVAELFSWSAVLTANYLLHAIENSIWTVVAVLVVAGFVSVQARVDEKCRAFLAAAIVCGAAYVLFMTLVDVPMYLARWQADLIAGQEYLALRDGAREVLERCIVTRDWSAWRDDVPWLTLYFTLAVWISIALAHVPPFKAVSPSTRS